jgi:hypothetical protein
MRNATVLNLVIESAPRIVAAVDEFRNFAGTPLNTASSYLLTSQSLNFLSSRGV